MKVVNKYPDISLNWLKTDPMQLLKKMFWANTVNSE